MDISFSNFFLIDTQMFTHSWNHQLSADTQAEYLQSQLLILHFHLISIPLLKLSVWTPDVRSSLVFNGLIFKPFMLLLVNGEETQGVTKLWLMHQLPFCCYDKTLQPWKPTDRSFFGLMFPEGEFILVGKQGIKGRHRNRNRKLRMCILYCELEVGWGYQLSMPSPSDVTPPARLDHLNFPTVPPAGPVFKGWIYPGRFSLTTLQWVWITIERTSVWGTNPVLINGLVIHGKLMAYQAQKQGTSLCYGGASCFEDVNH